MATACSLQLSKKQFRVTADKGKNRSGLYDRIWQLSWSNHVQNSFYSIATTLGYNWSTIRRLFTLYKLLRQSRTDKPTACSSQLLLFLAFLTVKLCHCHASTVDRSCKASIMSTFLVPADRFSLITFEQCIDVFRSRCAGSWMNGSGGETLSLYWKSDLSFSTSHLNCLNIAITSALSGMKIGYFSKFGRPQYLSSSDDRL